MSHRGLHTGSIMEIFEVLNTHLIDQFGIGYNHSRNTAQIHAKYTAGIVSSGSPVVVCSFRVDQIQMPNKQRCRRSNNESDWTTSTCVPWNMWQLIPY